MKALEPPPKRKHQSNINTPPECAHREGGEGRGVVTVQDMRNDHRGKQTQTFTTTIVTSATSTTSTITRTTQGVHDTGEAITIAAHGCCAFRARQTQFDAVIANNRVNVDVRKTVQQPAVGRGGQQGKGDGEQVKVRKKKGSRKGIWIRKTYVSASMFRVRKQRAAKCLE